MRCHRLLTSLILLSALMSAMLPGMARAGLVYEGFAYPPGEDLHGHNGGIGWGGAWFNQGGAQTFTHSPGLGFGALAVSPGAATTPASAVVNVSTYPRFLADPVGTDNTTLYLSFLLRPEAGFGFYGGLNLDGGLFIGKSDPGTTYSLESTTIAHSSVVAQAGTTVLLVLRAQFLAGDDIFDLFVDPTPGGPEPVAADATLLDFDLGERTSLYINNPGGWTIDEIRLGPTFAAVTPAAVPAPASLPLLVGGLAAIGLARRRRRSS